MMPNYNSVIGPVPGVEGAFITGAMRDGWEIGPCLGQLLGDLILGHELDLPLFNPPPYDDNEATNDPSQR